MTCKTSNYEEYYSKYELCIIDNLKKLLPVKPLANLDCIHKVYKLFAITFSYHYHLHIFVKSIPHRSTDIYRNLHKLKT